MNGFKTMLNKGRNTMDDMVSVMGGMDKPRGGRTSNLRKKATRSNREKLNKSNREKIVKSLRASKTAPMSEVETVDPEKEVRQIAGRDPEALSEEQMKNFRAFIAQYDAMGVKGMLSEFEAIKMYNLQPFDVSSHEVNVPKNRYKDIFCLEHSRVKLTDGKEGGDYVHANHVRGPPFLNRFIATQGPTEKTINDFWRMVVQENVGYIFMLCSLVEMGKKKCEQYYPEAEGESRLYQDIKVTLESRNEDVHFVNTKLLVEAPGKRRYVYHNFWRNWPDRGNPKTALAGLRLLQQSRQTTCTTIVHCSAGVGRTGTLLAIEYLIQKILSSPPPYDMKEMLKTIRNQRAHSIQTAPQYAYVAFAIFRLMTIKDASVIPMFMKFSTDLQTITGVKVEVQPLAQPPSLPSYQSGGAR